MYNWAKHPELWGDSYYSFNQIVNYAISNKLPLILAGDIINVKRPDARTIGLLMDRINDMAAAKLEIYFIQGQHELNREWPWMNTHKAPLHIHQVPFEIGKRKFYGLDYVPADQLQQELDKIPIGTDILIGHQVWREHMWYAGAKVAGDGAFADIPYVKEVITGDFHAHKVTTYKGKHGQDMTVVSPGSTYMLALDEDPRKFFFVLYDDMTVASIPIKTRPFIRTRIGSVASLEAFIRKHGTIDKQHPVDPELPGPLRIPIWHVEFYDNVPDVVKRLEQVAIGKAHLFLRPLRIRDEVPSVEDEKSQSVAIQPSLEGYLPYCIPTDDPSYNTALRLLRSNDPKTELQNIVDETIAEEIAIEETDSWGADSVQEG